MQWKVHWVFSFSFMNCSVFGLFFRFPRVFAYQLTFGRMPVTGYLCRRCYRARSIEKGAESVPLWAVASNLQALYSHFAMPAQVSWKTMLQLGLGAWGLGHLCRDFVFPLSSQSLGVRVPWLQDICVLVPREAWNVLHLLHFFDCKGSLIWVEVSTDLYCFTRQILSTYCWRGNSYRWEVSSGPSESFWKLGWQTWRNYQVQGIFTKCSVIQRMLQIFKIGSDHWSLGMIKGFTRGQS